MANFYKKQLIVNGDMSLGSITTDAILKDKFSLISFAYSWVGTAPVGTIIVQVSNDYTVDNFNNPLNPGTWNTIPFSDSSGATVTSAAVTGDTGNGYINIGPIAAYAIRTVYTSTSGVGLIQCVATGMVY